MNRDGVATAYGSHWGASSIMDNIFWGPDYATEAVTAQEEMEELEGIDGGDEGSVLIDWDAKRMLWWSANCRLPVHQRLFNKLAAQNWPGWQIETARGCQAEVLEYFGIDVYGGEDEEEEEREEDEHGAEDEQIIEQEMITRPEVSEGPIPNLDELETGCWLAVRRDGGAWEDYFISEYDDDDLLRAGHHWLDTLPRERSLGGPAPELVTASGIVVDFAEKTIWFWKGTRYGWSERQLQKSWPHFRFRDIDEQWLGQVQVTGRSPADLQVEERSILGGVVGSLLGDSSIDLHEKMSNVLGVARGIRAGCLGITLMVGVLGGALAYWINHTAAIVIVAVLFALCLAATIGFWRKSAGAISVLEATSSSRDRFHKGMNVEQKRPIMSQALASAGFPSLDQLEAAGEVPDLYGWEDDEEDEEEE